MMQPIEDAELTALIARYGPPTQSDVDLGELRFAPIGQPDRRAEVCMVVQRPDGTLITAQKRHYPAGVFRLLTGGIAPAESVEQALLREIVEETGLETRVTRFLALLCYRRGASPPVFATYAFLCEEYAGELMATDPAEEIVAFRMVTPAELRNLAATLEMQADSYGAHVRGSWQAWGRFRALTHRAVAAILE